MKPPVVSLCDRTGVMVKPWADAGYPCIIVDIQHPPGTSASTHQNNILTLGEDVVQLAREPQRWIRPAAIYFAFPPCTHLANSGNRYKRDKGLEKLYEALGLVIACKRICEASESPWMLENPVGSLSTYWREPDFTFHPWHYTTPKEQKLTCIWAGNNFIMPPREVFTKPADLKEKCWKMPPSPDRGDKRSVTPEGFAQAVFAANEPWIREKTA